MARSRAAASQRLQDGHLRLLRQMGRAPPSERLRRQRAECGERGRLPPQVRCAGKPAVVPYRGGERLRPGRTCPRPRDSAALEKRREGEGTGGTRHARRISRHGRRTQGRLLRRSVRRRRRLDLPEVSCRVMAAKLQGIFTPTLVALDERGDINEPELRRFISWLIEHGVHGLYPNGSTGEFTRFTAEERRRIVRIVCEEARGRVPVLAGAAEANVKETIAAC